MTTVSAQLGVTPTPVQGGNSRSRRDDAPTEAFGDFVKAGEKRGRQSEPDPDHPPMPAGARLGDVGRNGLSSRWDHDGDGGEALSDKDEMFGKKPEHSHATPAGSSSRSKSLTAEVPDPDADASDKESPKPELAPQLVQIDPAKEENGPHARQNNGAEVAIADGEKGQPSTAATEVRANRAAADIGAGSVATTDTEAAVAASAGITAQPRGGQPGWPEKGRESASRSGPAAAPASAAPSPEGNQDPQVARPTVRPEPDNDATGDRSDDRKQSKPKVSLVASQTLPAPVNGGPVSTTTAAFLDVLSSHPILKVQDSRAPAAAATAGQFQASMLRSIKIQLHPVELGTVTAELRMAGNQLSVDLRVENAEAHHRLSNDTDAIVKSLRALGFDIDKVAIQPLQPAIHSGRADAATAGAGTSQRDFQSGFSGSSEGNNARSDGRGNGSGGRNEATYGEVGSGSPRDRPSRDLYI